MPQKKLLTILAHPDDESFGPGGTFAKYAREGVDVHICIATDGAAGSIAEGHENARGNLVEIRSAELDRAITILDATLHKLNYRDSGYINDPANNHPDAFIQSNTAEAVGQVVKLIRTIRPQIVITHDETGGYYHPDHIRCWEITTQAFHAASDPAQYPDAGIPFKPDRLYYTAFPNRMIKVLIRIMRLRRQDPTKMGRNKDIDMTRLGIEAKKLHATIDFRTYWDIVTAASAAHATQGGGGGGPFRMVPLFLRKRFLAKNTYIRAYPPTKDGFTETDLFP